MLGLSVVVPSLAIIRASIAAVWLYEGLWCKLLGRVHSQVQVVTAVPRLGPRFGPMFLKALGVVEVALALWVLAGIAPGACAVVQTALLVVLNANGASYWVVNSLTDELSNETMLAIAKGLKPLTGAK